MNRRKFLALLGLTACNDNLEDMITSKKMWVWGGGGVPYTETEEPFVDGYTEYTPTFTGFSVSPTVEARYLEVGGMVHLWMTTTTNGTSNATTLTFNLPIATVAGVSQNGVISAVTDGGNAKTVPGRIVLTAGSTTATCFVDSGLAIWTSGGAKGVSFNIIYEASGYTAYTPTFGGFSTSPTVTARYTNAIANFTHLSITTTAHGTSNATAANSLTVTLPIQSANTVTQYHPVLSITNSGSLQANGGVIVIPPNSLTATVYRTGSLATVWTGSGNKSFNLSIKYESIT